ncbi:hypothetical protein Afil01_64510 [Actinorhabdospora filicis]|uniref:Uncharacterized protein n=1 Tax=Actinorhabdospora filicis TaxID=1785913 RepID=A0A9W6SRL7_9ACTN|nr:hypothetical protein [Actinorhabdospora filicis]GLZ81644.1 hypothetical protein Afil01_64510 [Actinorhabdospora filicis]
MERLLRGTLGLGVFSFGSGGVWAFFWPESFYRHIATYPPFNLHLFHDVGAFQLGVAAALLGCLMWSDLLRVGLFGGMAGTVAHAVSHLLDRDLGGYPSDPWVTSALAVVFTVMFVLRLASRRREG